MLFWVGGAIIFHINAFQTLAQLLNGNQLFDAFALILCKGNNNP